MVYQLKQPIKKVKIFGDLLVSSSADRYDRYTRPMPFRAFRRLSLEGLHYRLGIFPLGCFCFIFVQYFSVPIERIHFLVTQLCAIGSVLTTFAF